MTSSLSMCGRAVILGAAMLLIPATSAAQQWNDARTQSLVHAAVERRAQQLADSGLVDYRARAHGYLTFLAQLGEGFQEPPRVVKADELALEVYWRAPNLSKQHIVGRRDTTLFPTDITYHRDHLGIVQNNFPEIIRLGDGDEVSDVPHPLSAAGLLAYDFAISDSLRMTIPGRAISMYEVKVRPRDDRQPRVIGALYLDRDNGQVVRMALSFTRAAFLDKQLEDLFVVLENGLVGGQFWLPRRQEIEIRRSATWLDYPIRGIIRGRWEIGGYELNVGLPASLFTGPEIVMTPRARERRDWPSASILDSLPPDIRAVTAEEIQRVQAEVRTLVREQALQRVRGVTLAARGISDFARFNRVEGLALGAGFTTRLGGGFSLTGRGRYGLEDRALKGRLSLAWQRAQGGTLSAFHSDDFRDVGSIPERSTMVNSLAAQELGSDHTNPYGVRELGVNAGGRLGGGQAGWAIEVARERHRELRVNVTPPRGVYRSPPPAAPFQGERATLRVQQPTRLWLFGTEARADAELRLLRSDSTTVARGSIAVDLEKPVGNLRLVLRTLGGAATASRFLHAQDLVFLGGAESAPGYDFHSLIGDRALSQRVELQMPVPFPAVRLGRFGRSAARATLAPHATAVLLHGVLVERFSFQDARRGNLDRVMHSSSGLYRSAGVSLLFAFDILRLDVSRGLDAGGRWRFSLDVVRPYWRVL